MAELPPPLFAQLEPVTAPVLIELACGWEAAILARYTPCGDQALGGRIIARCRHWHRSHAAANRCAARLFRRRCPRLASR